MLKKGKTANRKGQQKRKTEGFQCKNRKTDLKNGQTKNPNAPLQNLKFRIHDCLVFPYKEYNLRQKK